MSKYFPMMNYDNSSQNEELALSLSDLPIDKTNQSKPAETQDQFDFGLFRTHSASTESQMCSADEVFFQGQILPFRHSVSNPTQYMRSESMDHSYSGGFRSSSIKSQYSSSSSGSSTTPTVNGCKPKVRNQFHSHPSPSPQIRSRSLRQGNSGHRNPNSTIWSFLHTGLIRTVGPEISINNNTFGSRNSASSGSNERNVGRRKKQRVFDINGGLFGGCKCSSVLNAVEILVPTSSKIVNEDKEKDESEKQKPKLKQAVLRNRTFEWLKQLSLSLEDGSG